MWHFPLWHFLNAPHCSQRNLPLLTFSLLIPVSSHCSQQCGCIQTAPPTNEEIHSNHLIIWPVVQQWVIYFMAPSATEQASEGHLTLGEGGRLEMTCWAWPQIKAHLIYHAFFLCFHSFLLPPSSHGMSWCYGVGLKCTPSSFGVLFYCILIVVSSIVQLKVTVSYSDLILTSHPGHMAAIRDFTHFSLGDTSSFTKTALH